MPLIERDDYRVVPGIPSRVAEIIPMVVVGELLGYAERRRSAEQIILEVDEVDACVLADHSEIASTVDLWIGRPEGCDGSPSLCHDMISFRLFAALAPS